MSFDTRTFRNALGCFPTGVTIVTTLGNDSLRVGVTVSSFTSVSLTPPLILFCLDDRHSGLEAYRQCGHFAINVLSEDQRALSVQFSSRKHDKWKGVAFENWSSGVPILDDCVANFECALVDVRDGGDHRIFIGRVERMRYSETAKPLVYCRGGYAELAGMTP
ncbi:MAG TPA: flavin reductase family protein [Telmatospirillum sp.]|nr:flavin reductase family protein [Telmatospirillum sp.]